jgi:hypothetical protein
MSVQTLKQTLQMMHTKGMYGELVFYLEACESGSMFEGQLARGMNSDIFNIFFLQFYIFFKNFSSFLI